MDIKDNKIILKTALSLFLICAVAAGLLGAINMITSPIITKNNENAADEARLQVLSSADSFELMTADDGTAYYEGRLDGEITGYVFTTSASGYGGTVEVMTGITVDGTVSGISILTINETPGLGMNAKKDSFLSQFTGQTGAFSVVKNKAPKSNEILAITSATITSGAVTNAVNEAIEIYKSVKGE